VVPGNKAPINQNGVSPRAMDTGGSGSFLSVFYALPFFGWAASPPYPGAANQNDRVISSNPLSRPSQVSEDKF